MAPRTPPNPRTPHDAVRCTTRKNVGPAHAGMAAYRLMMLGPAYAGVNKKTPRELVGGSFLLRLPCPLSRAAPHAHSERPPCGVSRAQDGGPVHRIHTEADLVAGAVERLARAHRPQFADTHRRGAVDRHHQGPLPLASTHISEERIDMRGHCCPPSGMQSTHKARCSSTRWRVTVSSMASRADSHVG